MWLVGLQVAHEVQGLQHIVHLPLALLRTRCWAEKGLALPVCYLLPVALLQQSISHYRHLQWTSCMTVVSIYGLRFGAACTCTCSASVA